MSVSPSSQFWTGKRVLVTGHTGFKGGWLVLMLNRLGAEVTGISLAPNSQPNLFGMANVADECESHFCDIRDRDGLARLVTAARPEVVLHLAAQPLVRASYREPVETFAANVMGTIHLLDALRAVSDCRAAVMITTDKVYENREWSWPYREIDALGGHDPYSASKAACETAIASYRRAFLEQNGLAVASARAGNVIGGGDWSEDRLLPDAIRAWHKGAALEIRNPASTRPWQHVLEPLTAYLTLAQALWSQPELAQAWNFGPNPTDNAPVRAVIDIAKSAWGAGAAVEYGNAGGPHEAGRLSLDIAKATDILGVRPRWTLNEAVTRTVNWYRDALAGASARALCEADIQAWEASL